MNNKKEELSNKTKQTLTLFLFSAVIIFTLTISVIVMNYNNNNGDDTDDSDEIEVQTLSGNMTLDGNYIVVDNLPLVRLNYYDEDTGIRSGIMVANDGTIYNYSYNETTVEYPNSDLFVVNQTIYYNNMTSTVGNISEDDLYSLKDYIKNIGYEYEKDEAVFDTVGNSISVTNYENEDNIVLINSEGVKNINTNTDFVLEILSKYDIKL